MTGDSEGRRTFNSAAALYHAARPGYPEALFDDIVALSGIPAGGRILEIGPGTGKATVPMAHRGYRIDAIELGPDLAVEARHNLRDFPEVGIDIGSFEDAEIKPETYDLVLSATAFHWIAQPAGYEKVAHALKPGGAFALFRHHHVKNNPDDGFFDRVQKFYGREQPGADPDYRLPPEDEVSDETETILATDHFKSVVTRRFGWDETYDSTTYINLLNTYSDHIAMDSAGRERLYSAIIGLIEGPYGGQITKRYLAILHIAHRK